MKDALKLALEVLKQFRECDDPEHEDWELAHKAITAVKEALAQDEQSSSQEPVVQWDSDGWGDLLVDSLPDGTLLYTISPKRPWVGLTDEEKQTIYQSMMWGPSIYGYADAIEATLKEKNT